MAPKATLLFLIMTSIMLSALTTSSHGRKLLTEANAVPSEEEYSRLYLTALPKGRVPASTPSKKGHADIVDEKLIARHLAAVDRILRSVPSPGVGH